MIMEMLNASLPFLSILSRVICVMYSLSLSKYGVPVAGRCMFMFVHCSSCNRITVMCIMFLIGYPPLPEQVLLPGNMT